MRENENRVKTLVKDNEERKTREASQQKKEDDKPILGGGRLMLTAGPGLSPSPQPYANGIVPQPTGFGSF
jgi:clathrin heavy chain